MGTCCGVKSSPSAGELNPIEREAHDEIETGLMNGFKNDNKVKKLLLLGAGSSGKSTIFRQLKIVYKEGFVDSEVNEVIPIIRRNCVWGIMILLKKTQQLYEMDENEYKDCYIDLDDISENVLNAIKTVANMKEETFEDYENTFLSYISNVDDDEVTIDDNTERRIQEKKNELYVLSQSISIIWNLNEIQTTFIKRSDAYVAFSFPDNMEYFFDKINKIFEWNYSPTDDDILKCRIRTTGLIHAYYEKENISFTITDVGGQRNERKKWIHGFEGVTAVIFVAALNHYGTVLFEDESKNAMIESLELFFETINLKWFKKTEIILFLNKDDLFKQYIENDIPLSLCFNNNNNNNCIYKKEYDNDQNYYPKSSKQKNNNNNNHNNTMMRAQIVDDEDNMAMINGDYDESGDNNNHNINYDHHHHQPTSIIDSENINNYEYRRKSAIYPKPDLTYSAKDIYDNGRWTNESNEKWFEFIYNDYLHWITEQYLSKNLHPELKRVFVHVTTATDPNNVKKVFWNVCNISPSSI